jgi:periplasmic divalent cation tolerance protein
MASPIQLVVTTCETLSDAEELGRRLVEEHLAACATSLPGAISHYVWEGKRERAEECLLLIKTTVEALPALERRLYELHDYEVPEFLVLPPVYVGAAYAEWVESTVARS